ncbi:polysaccharide pyruvyl transferase family protein [Ectothiorhodospira shaposhnikovii]|nr:polysaccharide pyruvyl transferase family protein [Ectothiorhodospira shaposhnikovii]
MSNSSDNFESTTALGSQALKYAALVHDILDPLIAHGSPVALFDFPNYSNVGDSAIWLGEEAFLSKRPDLHTVAVEDCGIRHYGLPDLPDSAIILIQGGGNLGDLWPHHQALREKLIGHYRQHRIIQLPQSIHFRDATNADQCRDTFSGHPDFHLLVRDHDSLEQGQRLHQGPTYLCPDMALCLGHLPRTTPSRYPVVGLLRTDKEAINDEAFPAPLGDTLIVDWIDESPSRTQQITKVIERIQIQYPRRSSILYGIKRRLYHQLAKERLKRGCDILSSGHVVITDRLHAHILCTLMGIPHVVLDNNYRKIGNFRDAWHTGENICASASTLAEAKDKAEELFNTFQASGPK